MRILSRVSCFREVWRSAVLVVRYGRERGQIVADVDAGLADIAPLANPDIVDRLREGTELNDVDPVTIYGGGAAGYTDYPTLTRV